MSAWRREALKRVPGCRQIIEEAISLSSLWIELYLEFAAAYDRANIVGSSIFHQPADQLIISGVYDYAEWCLLQSDNQDALSFAIVDFYESLGINSFARAEIPKYMRPEVFEALRQANVFEYFVNSDEYDTFVEAYQDYQNSLAIAGHPNSECDANLWSNKALHPT